MWKYKLAPGGSTFAAGALDVLGLIPDVVEGHRLTRSITTDLAHTYFAEDFRAIVAHLTWQSHDAKANRAEAVFDELFLCLVARNSLVFVHTDLAELPIEVMAEFFI